MLKKFLGLSIVTVMSIMTLQAEEAPKEGVQSEILLALEDSQTTDPVDNEEETLEELELDAMNPSATLAKCNGGCCGGKKRG